MKKLISLILCAVMLVCAFSACSSQNEKQDDGRLNIVCTIFPEYDWVIQLLGDRASEVDVTLLLNSGNDMHSFQPSADDMIKISECDMFIYVGGESDKWADDALASAKNENMIVINLLDVLGDNAKTERIIEGMQVDEEEDSEFDEHVWLSLINARLFCTRIAEKLTQLDPEYADLYLENASAYVEKINELHNRYQTELMQLGNTFPTLLFGDRFPFRYMTDDYGIQYFAAFAGCSAETEASFETITFLSDKVDELGLKYIMIIDGSSEDIANTIINNTNTKDQQILVLNSMQTTTLEDAENGQSYYSIMSDNLDVLKTALA